MKTAEKIIYTAFTEHTDSLGHSLKMPEEPFLLARLIKYKLRWAGMLLEWISVYERLPNEKQPVMVSHDGFYCTAYLQDGKWYEWWNECVVQDVTHWMPKPKPPQT